MQIQTAHDTGKGTYEVTLVDGTVMFVPNDPHNADYVRMQAWLAAGNSLT